MKIKGQVLKNDNLEIVVIPRKDTNLVFKFRPVLDTSEFDNYLKKPLPPTITYPDGGTALDYEDKDYKKKLIDYLTAKQDWMFIQSMLATEDLEFDTVKLNDPETWSKIDDELKAAEFTQVEINLMYNGFQIANTLNESRLDEAKESFLATLRAGNQQS